MGIVLVILGILTVCGTFLLGGSFSAASAIQQQLAELQGVNVSLGLIILALGCILHRLNYPRPATDAARRAEKDPLIAFLLSKGARVDGLDFQPGGIPIFEESNTAGPWLESQRQQVRDALLAYQEQQKTI
ncbi:MAG TPA: hypothetical protein VGF92_07380 [Stellaceae bacterium]|jgi:hypothetical protein